MQIFHLFNVCTTVCYFAVRATAWLTVLDDNDTQPTVFDNETG